MKRYICIDGGTTNTRLSLVTDGEVVGTIKFNVGARVGISDKRALPEAVKSGISELLSKNCLSECDIDKILASGMITSDTGLVSLPHVTLPVGIAELKENSYETSLPEITSIPFVFIRGVKTNSEALGSADIMRGEETELMGVAASFDAAYMLMGSHTKIIKLGTDGKIASFKTTLTGEFISALAGNTILKDSFSLDFDSFDSEFLISGYEYANENGVNEALFKARILKNVFKKTEQEVYSFFLGACLSGEIKAVLNTGAGKIIIGGKRQLKRAIYELLTFAKIDAEMLSDEAVDKSVITGQIKIYEYGTV